MFYGITDLATFILGTIFIVLLPGPNSLYVMTVASRLGVGSGYRGACGIFVGDTILMVLSATGVASVLHATPALFMMLKYAGAAYLAWIGIGLLLAAIKRWRSTEARVPDESAAAGAPAASPQMARPFRTALQRPRTRHGFTPAMIVDKSHHP